MTKNVVITIIAVCLLSASLLAGVSERNDSVVVELDVVLSDYSSTCGEYIDGTKYTDPWDPDTACAPRPTTREDDYARLRSDAHFFILDNTGECLLFDGRLYRVGSGTLDEFFAEFTIPIGETISNSNVKFDSGCDFDSLAVVYHSGTESTFKLERDETYIFVMVEWTNECTGSSGYQRFSTQVSFTVPCCRNIRGNVDNDPNDIIDISDITYLVNYSYYSGPAPECPVEADVDGSGTIESAVDIPYLVDYMFYNGPAPASCP